MRWRPDMASYFPLKPDIKVIASRTRGEACRSISFDELSVRMILEKLSQNAVHASVANVNGLSCPLPRGAAVK